MCPSLEKKILCIKIYSSLKVKDSTRCVYITATRITHIPKQLCFDLSQISHLYPTQCLLSRPKRLAFKTYSYLCKVNSYADQRTSKFFNGLMTSPKYLWHIKATKHYWAQARNETETRKDGLYKHNSSILVALWFLGDNK